ncbi:MAG TPA: response regulator [Candidatus Gracilibacteria bacterium]|nr:response regulator [Candidatus Gracilibacteria bacterium]
MNSPQNSPIFVVVDDENDITDLIQSGIETFELGDSKTFNNPLQALAFIQENTQQDIIMITDICMPEMNGIELIKNSLIFHDRIKFIVVSGLINTKAEEVLKNESIPFFKKPITLKSLYQTAQALKDDFLVS